MTAALRQLGDPIDLGPLIAWEAGGAAAGMLIGLAVALWWDRRHR